jgi:hypothetical protein
MRNLLAPWTEQSVGCFSSNYVSFSARVWRLLTFSWCSLWPQPFPVFFIIKYLSIVTTATWFVLYVHGFKAVCLRKAKRHIRNSNKNLLHGPGYRYVNAVQLSLPVGRNTQFRTCTILVIFSRFWNTTDAIVSNNNKKPKTFIYITVNIYNIISFEELSLQRTLIRNYFYLLIFTCPRTS